MKAATGSCSVKKVCFCAKEFEVFLMVQSRGTLKKLRTLRSCHWRGSVRKGVLRNFAIFRGKHLWGPLAWNFIKIETQTQIFSGEFCEISKNTFLAEHPWATVSMLFRNFPFCVGYWHALEHNLGGQTQSTLVKWTVKLGVLVKIFIFSWDNMLFVWGICLLPEKMTLFFSILNK